jgi:hypothetical protein
VELRIGVTQSPRELEFDLGDDTDRDDLKSRIDAAMGSGEGVLWFTDRKGHEVGIPAGSIAYAEVGTADDEHRIGFGA